jgi:hypothetical protein
MVEMEERRVCSKNGFWQKSWGESVDYSVKIKVVI